MLTSSGCALLTVPLGTFIICCFTFKEPLIHIRCFLSSTYICIWNFTYGSRSWRIVESIVQIPFNPPLHNCFVIPCIWLKSELNSSIALLFLRNIYQQSFYIKTRRGGNVIPSAKMVNRTVHWRFSRPD